MTLKLRSATSVFAAVLTLLAAHSTPLLARETATLFAALTPPGALLDGSIGATDLIASATSSVDYSP